MKLWTWLDALHLFCSLPIILSFLSESDLYFPCRITPSSLSGLVFGGFVVDVTPVIVQGCELAGETWSWDFLRPWRRRISLSTWSWKHVNPRAVLMGVVSLRQERRQKGGRREGLTQIHKFIMWVESLEPVNSCLLLKLFWVGFSCHWSLSPLKNACVLIYLKGCRWFRGLQICGSSLKWI